MAEEQKLEGLSKFLLDNAYVGCSLKNFTSVELAFKEIGKCMDELSLDMDNENTQEIASKIFIKLASMKCALETYIQDTQEYLDAIKE